MNIVNKLTIRHLKQNRRRTLITIIGVIISVAMVTAVATLGISFMDLLQRQTIATDGEWHVVYQDVKRDQLRGIREDGLTKEVILSRDLGYARLEGSQNVRKPYLYIRAYNSLGFEKFPIELSEGRLPSSVDEVVVSEEIAQTARVPVAIGDRLSLDVGERHVAEIANSLTQFDSWQDGESLQGTKLETYTVVGIIKRPTWEPTWAPGYTVLTYIDEGFTGTVDAAVILREVKGSLYAHAEVLAKELGIETVGYNNNLLRFYGVTNNDNLRSTLFSLSAIIMTVIIVGSVSLIYNAFAISVSERARHLGMLSSVGATKRQKRNSVFFEGFLIGTISIPIGIIAGLVGIGITFWLINSAIQGALGVTESLRVVVTPAILLTALGVSILTIFISTYIPAMKASRITAIEAIRQTNDIKLTSKAVKTSKWVRKLFGIEAEIGLKNLKRNKRRYRATVFSLVISIVLFLVVSSFTANLKKSLELSQDGVNYDIQVTVHGNDFAQGVWDSIASMGDVTESSSIRELLANAWVSEEKIADQLKEVVKKDPSSLVDGKFQYELKIQSLDAESLKVYAEQVGVRVEQLLDPEHPAAVVIDTLPFEDEVAEKYVEMKAIHAKVGDRLDVVQGSGGSREVEIAALTDQFPMGILPSGAGVLNLIVSEQVMDDLVENPEDMFYFLYLKSSDPMKTQQQIEELKELHLSLYNVYQAREREEQMVMLMSVFTYGFIVLITAISIANIFNTISTSISLRKREFAMLRSVGMTPQGFNKMIHYESIFYGVKALLFGIPISIVLMYWIHQAVMNSFNFTFTLPWVNILWCLVAVFVIVGSAMVYSGAKVKKENILDGLKQESI